MDFISYASSSEGNAYSLSDGKTRLLIEAGLPVRELKRRVGFGLSLFDGCLLTHEHGDHSKGVEGVMDAGVDCYMTGGTAGALGVSGHRVEVIRAGVQFDIGSWVVFPFTAVHDAAEPVGFLFYSRVEKKRFLFATDTQYLKYYFKGLAYIAIEANYSEVDVEEGDVDVEVKKRLLRNHMSVEAVGRMLQANDLDVLEAVFLLHLSDERADELLFKTELEKQTGVPVYICEKKGKTELRGL